MSKRLLLIAVLTLFTNSYASDVDNAKIVSILAGEVYGDKVFLEVSPKPALSSCQSNPRYSYVFDPTTPVGKVTLSIVMTVYASGRDVYLNGDDTCALHGGVETLHQIRAK